MEPRLVAFYRNAMPDDQGRWVQEIQQWPDDALEWTHDYVQWMFPLKERSAFQPQAPVLDDDTIATFRADPAIQANLAASFERMLAFYGLKRAGPVQHGAIRPSEHFAARESNWLSPGNHNHLRLTRILKSMRLLGRSQDAETLFEGLREIYREESKQSRPRITAATFEFWSAAMKS